MDSKDLTTGCDRLKNLSIHLMLFELDKIGDSLTDWQQEFVISLQDRYYEGYDLSPRQMLKLEEVYAEYFVVQVPVK